MLYSFREINVSQLTERIALTCNVFRALFKFKLRNAYAENKCIINTEERVHERKREHF